MTKQNIIIRVKIKYEMSNIPRYNSETFLFHGF
jgi:hypothetical protein